MMSDWNRESNYGRENGLMQKIGQAQHFSPLQRIAENSGV
jgi:hypothetical protein